MPDPDGPDASALQPGYDRLAAFLPRPWVMRSAGAGAADFERSLRYGYRAGASGYLAGRAIWWEAFRHFPDLGMMEKALASESVATLERLNALTYELAPPWHRHDGIGAIMPRPDADDTTFPAEYGEP